jgi:hypothetical protein
MLGWRRLNAEYKAVEPTFFGSHTNSLKELTVESGGLVPMSEPVREMFAYTSGGRQTIELDAYDAFLVAGALGLFQVMEICRTHRIVKHMRDGSDGQLISCAVLREAVQNGVKRSTAVITARKIRRVTKAPVIVLADPMPTAGIMQHPVRSRYWSDPVIRQDLTALYQSALARLGKQGWCNLVAQPPCTIFDACFTKSEYSLGAIKLTAGLATTYAHGEYFHMNSDYGEVVLREVLATLRAD